MSQRQIDLIGAALGWGAQLHAAQEGPQALKAFGLLQSLQQKNPQVQWRSDVIPSQIYTPDLNLDYPARLAQVLTFSEKLAQAVLATFQAQRFPVVLGGDHAIAIGTWSAMVQALNAAAHFGLIWIDAHMDSHTLETSPSTAIHGMPLAVLLGHGDPSLVNLGIKGAKLNPRHVVLIGVRSYESGEAALLRKLNVKIYYMNEVKKRGFSAVFNEALNYVTHRTKGFGISIDLDGFDPSVAPGVGSPVLDGLSAEDVCAELAKLKQSQLKALEIAEFNPSLDLSNKTATLVQNLLLNII